MSKNKTLKHQDNNTLLASAHTVSDVVVKCINTTSDSVLDMKILKGKYDIHIDFHDDESVYKDGVIGYSDWASTRISTNWNRKCKRNALSTIHHEIWYLVHARDGGITGSDGYHKVVGSFHKYHGTYGFGFDVSGNLGHKKLDKISMIRTPTHIMGFQMYLIHPMELKANLYALAKMRGWCDDTVGLVRGAEEMIKVNEKMSGMEIAWGWNQNYAKVCRLSPFEGMILKRNIIFNWSCFLKLKEHNFKTSYLPELFDEIDKHQCRTMNKLMDTI